MKPELVKRIEEVKAKHPRNKAAALDRLATDLGLTQGLVNNVIYVDFKAKKVIK